MRLACTLLLCTMLTGGVHTAQGQTQDGPQFGITLGVNRATLSASDAAVAPSGQFAFTGGVVARLWSVGPLSLQPELLLSQKGGTIEPEGEAGIQYGVGYIELPVLVTVEGPSMGAVTPYGLGGGFGGVKVFERQQHSAGELNIPFDSGLSFFRRYDAGVTAGVGGYLSLGQRRLNLVVRRSWGVVDVADPPDTSEETIFSDAPFPSSATTRTWTVLLRMGL